MNRTIVLLCAILFAASTSDAFQFMSKWKMPSSVDIDNLEKVKERFGDKSKFSIDEGLKCLLRCSYCFQLDE